MTKAQTAFPLHGVIGIVDSSEKQLELALESQLSCVEVRADLLKTAGLDNDALLALVSAVKSAGLACLFTLRHADQGGTFAAAETERMDICKRALDAGADIIDLEHGTESSKVLLKDSVPMILSYHNFNAMLSAEELSNLSQEMEVQAPAAIKIIPTGKSLTDAVTMLKWVAAASDQVRRIGFTMGGEGATSRTVHQLHRGR